MLVGKGPRNWKPIWAAEFWQDITARVERLTVKVRHVDVHIPKSRANEEHRNNEQVDKAAKGRDATYQWAHDRRVDLTMDNISQVIHNCETCDAIKQAKRVKPLWYGGRWFKYSPIWPVRKSDGEWRLTVDYRALNEVTPPLSATVPDMLELQYELESKAAKWYATIDIANAFFSIPLAAECRPQFAFTWRGVQYTWNRLPQGWKHSPTICHGLIQAALEKGEAPEHLQYIDDIIVWGNTAMEVFEKGEKIIQILLKAGFAIKQSKVKGPAREIQFLGVKWQDGRWQIPTEVINKITAMSPPTSKKETQAFLGTIGFWWMHIPEYSQIVSPLYLVTRKKNDFHWGPEQQQAFAQIKQEVAHAVALGPVRTGPDVKNVLYSAAGNNGLSWSLWQKVPGETRGRPLGFWS
ncbi:hypothetical protein DUI87_03141 [Hirundo rustica rustica]|uniref:ribonuclease H n=1 Tax=Hirundo rustica rustica TaxID=333673 RepID=A0A3M0L2R6_HIRRU|nr:hypothetical protein DUI87_03141 [Hirundo rustica rustica]